MAETAASGSNRNLSLNAVRLNNSQPTVADMQWSCVKFKTNQEQICRRARQWTLPSMPPDPAQISTLYVCISGCQMLSARPGRRPMRRMRNVCPIPPTKRQRLNCNCNCRLLNLTTV